MRETVSQYGENLAMQPYTLLLAEHYQKAHEQTNYFWEKRNRTFLILLGVIGAGTLLTYKVPLAAPLLADLVSKLLGIEDAAQRAELRNSFPYGLLQSILLMVVFYLTVSLYHHTTSIQRGYLYLEKVEEDIRQSLSLPESSVSFTREGRFYWTYRPRFFSSLLGAVYVGMLGLLLMAFLGMRIYDDFSSGQRLFGVVDVLIAAPTLLFFCAYAVSSSWWFRRLLRIKS
jgi:hypothetical protein